MEFDQMLQLIDRVSGSNLDSFVYEQNGMKLKLEKKKQKIQVSRETGSLEMIEAAAPAEAVPAAQPLSRTLADRSSDVKKMRNDRADRLLIEITLPARKTIMPLGS